MIAMISMFPTCIDEHAHGHLDLVNRGGAGRKHDAPGVDEEHCLLLVVALLDQLSVRLFLNQSAGCDLAHSCPLFLVQYVDYSAENTICKV